MYPSNTQVFPAAQVVSAHISLDDLFAESLASLQEKADTKAARALLSNGTKLSTAERDAIQDSVRNFELKREWVAQAHVVMFSRQCCKSCGEFHSTFLGFFQRQVHKTSKVERWVASTRPTETTLPRESKYQDEMAEMCQECAFNIGFDVEED